MRHPEWTAHISELKEKYPLRYDHSQLTGPYIIEKLYELTKGDAIITTEVGQNQMWAAQYFKYKEPRTFLSSGGLGTMGYGLGAAIGVISAGAQAVYSYFAPVTSLVTSTSTGPGRPLFAI